MYNDNRHDVTLVRNHSYNNINMSLYIDDRGYFLQNIILFFRNRVCGELWPELSCVWHKPKYIMDCILQLIIDLAMLVGGTRERKHTETGIEDTYTK